MTKKEALLLDLLDSEDPSLREIYLANFSVEFPSAPLLARVVSIAASDPSERVRHTAIQTLSRFWPDPHVVSLYADLLRNAPSDTAAAVVKAMQDLDDDQAIDELCRTYLTRTDFRVKGAIVLALDRRPFAVVKTFLLEHPLNDADEFLRAMTVTAISKKGDCSVIPHLRAHLSDPDARVRANAAEGLGRFYRHLPVDVFTNLLGDPSHRVQTAALKTLFKLGWDGIETHLDRMAHSSVGLFRDSAAYFLREVHSVQEQMHPFCPEEQACPAGVAVH